MLTKRNSGCYFLIHLFIFVGKDCDVRKVIQCAEMVRKFAVSIAGVSGHDKEKQPRHDHDVTNNSSQTNESASQFDILQLASSDIQASVDKLVDSVRQECMSSVTPRSKRLLPSHPQHVSLRKQ